MAQVDISGLDKAEVLAGLFNRSHQQAKGFLDTAGANNMSVEEARKILERSQNFDYLKGRVMKIDLSGDNVETWLYNRDVGNGAAEKIIEDIRAQSAGNSQEGQPKYLGDIKDKGPKDPKQKGSGDLPSH